MLHTGADGEGPIQHKLALPYDKMEPKDQLTLRAIFDKYLPKEEGETLLIDGEAEDTDGGE